ncbi:MAG: chitobiase/beta-hexosaminidase C-terminal domain-containing protein [Eubacteriales bacterium]
MYSEPILINKTTTLKAIAVAADGEMEQSLPSITVRREEPPPGSLQVSGATLEPGTVVYLTTGSENTGDLLFHRSHQSHQG